MKLTTFLTISLIFLFLFFILGISYGAVKIPMSTVISILIFKIASIGEITEEILRDRYRKINPKTLNKYHNVLRLSFLIPLCIKQKVPTHMTAKLCDCLVPPLNNM